MFSGTQFYKTLRDEILLKYDTTEEEKAILSTFLYRHRLYVQERSSGLEFHW